MEFDQDTGAGKIKAEERSRAKEKEKQGNRIPRQATKPRLLQGGQVAQSSSWDRKQRRKAGRGLQQRGSWETGGKGQAENSQRRKQGREKINIKMRRERQGQKRGENKAAKGEAWSVRTGRGKLGAKERGEGRQKLAETRRGPKKRQAWLV